MAHLACASCSWVTWATHQGCCLSQTPKCWHLGQRNAATCPAAAPQDRASLYPRFHTQAMKQCYVKEFCASYTSVGLPSLT